MSEFICEPCKYLFEKHDVPPFKADGRQNYDTPCPKCGKDAYKHWNLSDDIKTHPSNSMDMKVGAEAEKRWMAYDDRKSKKDKVRKESGQTAVALDLQQKSANSKINYEYKAVDKERLQERKALIKNEFYESGSKGRK